MEIVIYKGRNLVYFKLYNVDKNLTFPLFTFVRLLIRSTIIQKNKKLFSLKKKKHCGTFPHSMAE